MVAEETRCPLCELNCSERPHTDGSHTVDYDCENCGSYSLTDQAKGKVKTYSTEQRSLLSHFVQRHQGIPGKCFELYTTEIDRILASERLPGVREMADNFVLLLGDTQGGDPGRYCPWKAKRLCARLGAASADAVAYVVKELEGVGILDDRSSTATVDVRLTFKGWDRYEELRRGAVDSKRAFMAMRYGDAELNHVYLNCFKPAVTRAGFELERLDERAPAGHIDSRMLEVIRRSRFVVADITYDNSGAYWEAGFAEGLSKAVFYTVSKKWIADPNNKVHFDTDHFNRIEWVADNLDEAGGKLTAMIRNTFSAEAKMVDK